MTQPNKRKIRKPSKLKAGGFYWYKSEYGEVHYNKFLLQSVSGRLNEDAAWSGRPTVRCHVWDKTGSDMWHHDTVDGPHPGVWAHLFGPMVTPRALAEIPCISIGDRLRHIAIYNSRGGKVNGHRNKDTRSNRLAT